MLQNFTGMLEPRDNMIRIKEANRNFGNADTLLKLIKALHRIMRVLSLLINPSYGKSH
jgi:hypothetical protein